MNSTGTVLTMISAERSDAAGGGFLHEGNLLHALQRGRA